MSDALSLAEIDGPHVELLPARTVLSVFGVGFFDFEDADIDVNENTNTNTNTNTATATATLVPEDGVDGGDGVVDGVTG